MISDKYLSVGVTSVGGSLTSIKAGDRKYLWQPDPAVWTGQAPICFPVCGGLRDSRAVTESGKKVELARHGFARKMEFELLGCRAATPRWGFVSGEVTRAQYPFDLELMARYELEELDGHGVRIEFPDFDYLIVWSKPAGDFVALEPWSGLSICSDEDDVFEHKRGCIVAAPDQTVERSFTIQPF